MCFFIHKDYPNPLIASKNIPCYKLLDICDCGIDIGVWENKIKKGDIISPYQNTLYFKRKKWYRKTKDKVLMLVDSLHLSNKYIVYTIDRGLHSYSTEEVARSNKYDHKVYKAIIPIGTTYYYNPLSKEYVSEALEVYREIIDLKLSISKDIYSWFKKFKKK